MTITILLFLFSAIVSYLIGSISFAVIVSKAFGLSDPRTYGSKNPGATNVLRSGNKSAAIMTLVGDALKGWVAVAFAVWATGNVPDISSALHFSDASPNSSADSMIAVVAIAVFLGHLWPIFFKFIGGKGVATALGVLLGLNIWLGLGTLATWLVVVFCFRYSSLAALIASVFAPFYAALLFGAASPIFGAAFIMSALLVYRHQQNIRNLLAGKETRIGSKKS